MYTLLLPWYYQWYSMALPLPYFASAPSFIGASPADAAAEEKETLSDASSLIVSLLLRYKHCSQGQLIHHAKVGPTSLNAPLVHPSNHKLHPYLYVARGDHYGFTFTCWSYLIYLGDAR